MPIIAVDPGISGAICFNDWTTGQFEVVRMPVHTRQVARNKTRTAIDEGEVLSTLQMFAAIGATHLFIEQVGGMPGQSAPAAFVFGQGYGLVRGCALACGLAIEAIPPVVWKSALKVPKDKKAARQRASEMLPMFRHLWSMAKDDGAAEASLMALYGERWIKGQFTKRSEKDTTDIEAAKAMRERTAVRKLEKANVTRARVGRPLRAEPLITQGFPKL